MKRKDFIKSLLVLPTIPVIITEIQEEEKLLVTYSNTDGEDWGTFDECFDSTELPDEDDGKGNNGYAPSVRHRY